MKNSKFAKLFTIILIGGITLTACGAKTTQTSSTGTAKATTTSTTTPKKIIVGTGNNYKPYAFLDENNKSVGYGIDLLAEVDKRLPQYEFEIQAMDFTNVLLSLQSGKIDLAAHNYAVNAERKEKYLYATQPEKPVSDISGQNIVAVLKTSTVKSIEDLKGKNVQVEPGSQNAYVLEKYNKEHADKKVKLVYSTADVVTKLKSLDSGAIDAILSSSSVIDEYNKTYGDKYKVIGDSLYTGSVYYIYNKSETQLQQDVDKVLKQIIADGVEDKLLKKWNYK